MTTHELVIDKHGRLEFRCHAEPVDGVSPECWFACEDDDVTRTDLGECNAGIWFDASGIKVVNEFSLPMSIAWNSAGPVLELLDEREALRERVKALETKLKKFRDCELGLCGGSNFVDPIRGL